MREIWRNIQVWFRSAKFYNKFIREARKSQPYDWSHLLKIEKAYLERMRNYMQDSKYFDHDNNIKWITICINLLNIIIEEPDDPVYVNLRNAYRFYPRGMTPHKIDPWMEYMKTYPQDLRWQKAYDLYFAIRKEYSTYWWD